MQIVGRMLRLTNRIHSGAFLILVGIFICSITPAGQSQTASTGAVAGTVTDPAGAVVPGVEVAIVSETTGAKRTAVTGADGIYRFPLLPPSTYRVQASASGFKVAVRSGLPVQVTETTGLNIKLEIGAQSERVTVDAQPQLVQTDSNTLGRVADERTVTNLPLVSRNFTQIIGLSAGVSVGLTDAGQLGLGSGGMSNFTNEDLSVNGARSYDNNFQMNGVTANDQAGIFQWSGGVAIPSPDSIAEFKVLTGQYDASYGRNAGANVDVVTKSGSNTFHGNLFEFFRNEDLNANGYFFNAVGEPRGILRQNQFGGTLGGPIKKDKLLFFGSYQGTRQLNGLATGIAGGCGSTFAGPVLTNDRSAAALGALYGGLSGVEGGVTVASDGSNINPVALKLLNLKLPDGSYVVPTPKQIVNGEGQYAFSVPCPFREDQFMTNLDFQQSQKSKFAAKYFEANQNYTSETNGVATVPGSPESYLPHFRNLSVTHDYIFSPGLLNQAEFGFHRTAILSNTISSFTFPEIGSSVIPQTADLATIFLGQEFIGSLQNTLLASNVYTLQDTLSYLHRRHNVRVGGGFTRTAFDFNWNQGSQLTFLSMQDLLLGQSAQQDGSPFGVGNIYQSTDFPGIHSRNYVIWNPWAYAQDDFKISPRLMVNFGLRYERIGDFADQNGRNASFNVALADPNPPASGSQAGYLVASGFQGTLPSGSVRSNNEYGLYGDGQSTFGPRVGFSWQVLPASSRLVLRGGYAIYYSPFVGEQFVQTTFNAPWSLERSPAGSTNGNATWATPFGQLLSPSDFPIFPAYSPSTQLNILFVAPNARPPITQQYSLNFQSELANDYLLEIGYVGARATHLVENVSLNQASLASPSAPIRGQTTNTLANLLERVPIDGFTAAGLQSLQTTGESWYNALQASLTKRFTHGLQFLASYTYARLLDTEGGNTINTSTFSLVTGNQNRPGERYGPSATVRPHRFVVSLVYEMPKFFHGRVAGGMLNDWAISGVTTILSGHPLTIVSTNASNVLGINGYGGDFAEWAPGCTKSRLETSGPVRSKLNNYFNRSCIGDGQGNLLYYPVVGDDGIATGFGNMTPGLVNGPGMSNVDLALTKRFPVSWFHRESAWEFRAEAFNAFNAPHFADPDVNVSDGAAFGVISSTISNPRVLQLALKYNF